MPKKLTNLTKQYDKFAEKYVKEQTKFYSKYSDKSREAFYKQINFSLKNKKLLDVGCGSGKDLSYFKKKGAVVYGIDASKKMIEIAKKNNSSLINLSVQEAEKTNFKNNFFDIIISRYTLHYEMNLEKVFKELYRILKPKGFLIFLVAHPLLSFMAKKEKIYHKREVVKIPIYNNKIILKEPTHTFSEYLNNFVLKNFEILSFYESPGLENKPRESNIKEIVPDFLLLKLRKK